MVTCLKDNLNFYDRKSVRFNKAAKQYESDEARSGKGQTDTVAAGVYTTAYSAEGAYTDLVANLDYSRNKYTSAGNRTAVTTCGEWCCPQRPVNHLL